MSAPTINEMLEWLPAGWVESDARISKAIRTILEEYNKEGVSLITEEEVRLYQLEAIRTFLERVEKRKQSQFQRWAIDGYVGVDDGDILAAHMTAAEEELAAMEKGAQ